MSRLSADAGLSKRYTNHCIRATVATMLCAAGVSNQGIMSVTGHRNAESLSSYIVPSDQERRRSSGIIHAGGDTDSALALKSSGMIAEERSHSFFKQPDPLTFPTQSQTQAFSHLQSHSNTQSTLNIFSGNVSGGNITVNVYKQ